MSEFEIFTVQITSTKTLGNIINSDKNLNLVGFVMSLTPQRGEKHKLQVGIQIYLYVRVNNICFYF